MTQTELFFAVCELNIVRVIDALSRGAQIKNSCDRNHTLNCAINASLSVNPKKFDLDFIEGIINLGAKPCNVDNNKNTLSYTLRYANRFDRRKCGNPMQENVIKLIKLLIKVCNIEPVNSYPYNTLTRAVMTKNIEIVKIICDSNINAMPDNGDYDNTILNAIETQNPEILKYVIMKGAKTYKSNYLFSRFYENNLFNDEHDYIDRMLDLIMCSGEEVNTTEKYRCNGFTFFNLYFLPNEKISYVKKQILTCCEVLNPGAILSIDNGYITANYNKYKEDAIVMKKRLKIVMNELMKREKNIDVEISISKYIPECLVNIVDEYYDGPFVEFIDWDKVGVGEVNKNDEVNKIDIKN